MPAKKTVLSIHEPYMQRCLQLAALGAGRVAPNPMVGSVLVHEGRIIGEGYHRQYGGPHAEINCLDGVAASDRHLIPASTLYVSLEPCAHHGKTPPCTERIIRERIPEVVVACRDPFPAVNGKGIEQLEAAGLRVVPGVCEQEARRLNRRFFTRHQSQRPYIILKWAETADGKIAGPDGRPLAITNDLANRLVHRWRSEEAAILVGRGTVIADDPLLTNRFWTGPQPVRILADRQRRLPASMRVFNGDAPTIILNTREEKTEGNLRFLRVPEGDALGPVLELLSRDGIQSILVEGGAAIIDSFMRQGYWDELRRIVSGTVLAPGGLDAPRIREQDGGEGSYVLERTEYCGGNRIEYYVPGR